MAVYVVDYVVYARKRFSIADIQTSWPTDELGVGFSVGIKRFLYEHGQCVHASGDGTRPDWEYLSPPTPHPSITLLLLHRVELSEVTE